VKYVEYTNTPTVNLPEPGLGGFSVKPVVTINGRYTRSDSDRSVSATAIITNAGIEQAIIVVTIRSKDKKPMETKPFCAKPIALMIFRLFHKDT